MAEGEAGGSWWGGWLETAKAKSASAVQFLKKDLQEFTNVMKEDTTKAAEDVKKQLTQENASAATQKVKEGMSKVIGGITKALVIEPDGKEKSRSGRKPSGEPIFDRAKARLRAIQLDPNTYCDKPEGDPEEYKKWLESFVLDSKKGDISELLVANVDVRSLYTQLVPSEVSHADFWHRYFYKLYQLDQDEARKAALMKRADVVQEQVDLEWEDDDWGDIEGPASPPKPSAGILNAVMEGKEDTVTTDQAESAKIQSKRDEANSEPQNSAEEGSRVPENGTPIVNDTETVASDKASNEQEQKDAVEETTIQPQNTDTCLKLKSKDSKESSIGNIHSETNVQQSDALDKEKVNVGKKETSLEDDMPNKETTSLTQEVKNVNQDLTSVPTVPSVMEPLSVDTEIKTREKGDMVVVGSEGTTPSSDSTACTNKESTSLDDDWEKDFDDDIEVTEEDMKLASEAAKKLAESRATVDDGDDDWESWD